ncbi:hypothetical protein PQX77_014488 [Marasmius sp. AFHP31]|nr:hypothetical protein PQX77_014488 [Marasmius sp. AFHP31]
MHTIYFTLLPCFHIALASPLARQLTILNPFSLVAQETVIIEWSGGVPPYTLLLNSSTPEGGVMPTTLILDNQASSVAWTVDVHPGRSVAIELRDSSGLATKTNPIPVQSMRAKADADYDGGPRNDTSTHLIYTRASAKRELTEAQSVGLGVGIVAGIFALGMIIDCFKHT